MATWRRCLKVVAVLGYLLIHAAAVELSSAEHELLQSKRRASLLETDSLRRQFQGEDPATSIQQPKQHGLYLEEDGNHGSHHAAQQYEQQAHEKQQQQQLQARQQRTLQQEQQQKQQEADEQLGAPVAKVPLLTIAAMTAVMASMSGLGAVPYFFVGTMPAAWSGLANAVACGVMVSASFGLIQEGGQHSGLLSVAGVLLGALFISASKSWLDQHEEVSFEDFKGADAKKVVLIIGVMAAHAVGEGSGVGVSFSGRRGWAQGTLVTLAIGLHNVPEGLAVATVMAARGATPQKAFLWTVLSSMPQALVAVPSYLFVEAFTALLPVALGFAAGCMLWIVFAELMPEALEQTEHSTVATAATFSAAWLAGMSMAFEALEQPDGTLRNPLQADLSSLLPFLLACIPAVLAAGAAAAGALSVVRSRPAALGLTAGVQVALGLVGLLHQLFQRQAGLLALLGWALLGAGSAVAAWRLFFAKAGSPASPLQRKGSVDPELAAVLMAEGSGRFSSGGEVADGSGVQQRLQAQQRGGSSWDLLDGKQQRGQQGQQQQGGVYSPAAAGAGMPSSIDSNGFVQVPGPPPPFAAVYQAAASSGPGSTASAYNAPYSRDANASPEGILHLYSEPAQLPGLVVTVPSEAYKHVGVPPLLPYTLLVLLGYLLPYGMTVAAAVTTNLDGSSQLAVPLALLALPLGGAVAGLLCYAFSLSKQAVVALSAAVYSIAPVTAACILVTLPVGVVPTEEISYGSDATRDRQSMVAAGAMIAAGLLVCWPAAGRTNGSSAGAGVVVGAAASVFISALLGALCLGTPYCLVSAS